MEITTTTVTATPTSGISPSPISTNQISTSCPNVVKIPVPVVTPSEDIYTYIAVKGSLHAADCAIFGLNAEEIQALTKRFTNGSNEIINGLLVKAAPIEVINALGKLGYKVVCSTGEAEIVWTLSREV